MKKLIKVEITNHNNRKRFDAMFKCNNPGILGCPLGTGRTKAASIYNLLDRTNMESKTNLTMEDLEVIDNVVYPSQTK
jgi:hypothetical protein